MNKIAMMQLVKKELTNFKASEPYKCGTASNDSQQAIVMSGMLTNIANELRRQSDEITFIRETAVKFILMAIEEEMNRAAERERREATEAKEREIQEMERMIRNWKPSVGDKIKIVKETSSDKEKTKFKVGDIVSISSIDFDHYSPSIELTLGDVKVTEDHSTLQRKMEWGVIELVKEA